MNLSQRRDIQPSPPPIMNPPIEMKMEALNNMVDSKVDSLLEDFEDECLEAQFRAHAEVMKVRSDRFKTMREQREEG